MYTKTKQRIECNILKGEEQEETLEFFSYYLSLVYLCNPSFPAGNPSEMATMITGRPTIRKEGNPNTLLHDSTIFGDPKAWLQLPRNDVIHVNLSVDVAKFRNGEVERNSLDQHLTESGHEEILHQSCCCNTGSL